MASARRASAAPAVRVKVPNGGGVPSRPAHRGGGIDELIRVGLPEQLHGEPRGSGGKPSAVYQRAAVSVIRPAWTVPLEPKTSPRTS